ncbi:MAG: hypothetical protein NTV34_05195, partial [Proteobacteria bacterium]|nr:hypothetical protein [Pseudomonadota bacterium]
QLEAAYSDVIDAFSGKPNLEVYVNRESTDHFSFVINLSGHFRGMQINSNYKEQGVSGRIDTNDEDIWMTHRDILDGSFQALTIRISNAGSPESDKRESVYAVCALGD